MHALELVLKIKNILKKINNIFDNKDDPFRK
jgi:hypothetical protein